MKYCSKCNIRFKTGGKFCQKCGNPLTEVTPSYCLKCGAKLEADSNFCNSCGAHISGSVSAGTVGNTAPRTVQVPGRVPEPSKPAPGKLNLPKEAIIGIAVLLIALLGGGGYYFLSRNDKSALGALTAKVLSPIVDSNEATNKGATGNSGNNQQVPPPIVDNNKVTNKGAAGNSGNNQQMPPIIPGAVSKAYHSSADKEDSYIHSASLAVDGRTESCWSEGVPGLGIGENIVIYFNGTYKVSGLNIWIGHQKSEALFYQNARPISIRVEGSDGSSEIYSLRDEMGAQRVDFKKPINTSLIKIVVDQVVSGNKYQDTCIAEVSFF